MEFQHHPDGLIYIRTDTTTYAETLANFDLDVATVGSASMPSLPTNIIGRRYVPGQSHALTDGANQSQGDMPWGWGDAVLGAFDALVAAKEAREQVVV